MKISINLITFLLILVLPFSFVSTAFANEIQTGAWLGEWPSVTKKNIESFDSLTNTNHKYVHTFVNSNQNLTQWQGFLDYVDSTGKINILTLELKNKNGVDYTTADINKGTLDKQLALIASQLKSWKNGKEVWIQMMHEVNGNWYGWSIGKNKVNTNQSYINAYQRIVTIFRQAGATNIKFLYNVNAENVGPSTSFMGAYPGDIYVDYVSMNGYNWGNTRSGSSWMSFRSIFDKPYSELTKFSSRPVIITEFSSAESGGNKANWILDASQQIKSGVYPRLEAAIWFNENKETDWRVNSSVSSLNAYTFFK